MIHPMASRSSFTPRGTFSEAARIASNGVEIAYAAFGSGEPVVLLHGGEGSRAQYDTLHPLLGNGIRAITYHQRDTGDSHNPPTTYRMEDLARIARR